MSDGLSGCRDSHVIHDWKYRHAQDIIDTEYGGTKTYLEQVPWSAMHAGPVEVAGAVLNDVQCATNEECLQEYIQVWNSIIVN